MLHTDTLLHTLRVMRQLGCALALVVDAGGRPVGLVTEEELVRAWAAGPLVEVGEVMCPDEVALALGLVGGEGPRVGAGAEAVHTARPRGRLARRGRV